MWALPADLWASASGFLAVDVFVDGPAPGRAPSAAEDDLLDDCDADPAALFPLSFSYTP